MEKVERYFYPAVFTCEPGQEIAVCFPDLGCATSGIDDQDALLSARELLGCVMIGLEEDGRGAPIPHAAERDSDPTKRKSRSVGQPDCDSPRLAGRRCPRTGPRSFSGIAGRPQTAAPPPVGKARPGCAPLRVLSDPDSLAPYFECSVLFPKKAQSFFVPYPSPTAKAGRRRLSAPPPLQARASSCSSSRSSIVSKAQISHLE